MQDSVSIQAPCFKCGAVVEINMTQSMYEVDYLREAVISNAMCRDCTLAESNAEAAKKAAQAKAERDFRNKATFEARLKASQIEKYRLIYDPNHPKANTELFEWFRKRANDNIILTGLTGRCKTRVLQDYALREIDKGASVFYSPAMDLVDRIADAYQNKGEGRRFVAELKAYDLLIIDDFLKFTDSQPKVLYLWNLLERRYVRTDQERNFAAGKWNPMYWSPADRLDGWRFWLATNCSADQIGEKFDQYKNEAGKPIVRRILESCTGNIYRG